MLFIPYPPNWAAIMTSSDEFGGATLTTNVVIQQGFSVNRFRLSFSSLVSYTSAGGNILADKVVLLPATGGVREVSPTSDLVYAVNTLSVGADTFMIDNYAIVTSNALLYRFSGLKKTRDASGGTLFINEGAQTAVYSMNTKVTQLIRNASTFPLAIPPFSYNLEVIGSNVLINFGNSLGAYRITGSISGLNNSVGTLIFTGTSLAISIQGISHFFHVEEATVESTSSRDIVLANEYTDLFINIGTGQGLSVNNPRVLSIIRTIMSFSGTVGQFTVTSTGVTFNGVSVMQLMRGSTQSVTLAAGDQLSYTNGALTVTSGGNQVFNCSGVQRVTVQQGSGAAINDGSAAAISGPGTLFVRKSMAFFTNDTSVVRKINELAIMPVFTVTGMNALTVDGNAVITLGPSRRQHITSGQSIRYRNQNLVVFPSGGGNPVLILMNIGQFVIYIDGEHKSLTFTGSMPVVFTSVGTLYYNGSHGFFTNHDGVKNMIETVLNSPASPSTRSSTTTSSSGTMPSSSTTPSSNTSSTTPSHPTPAASTMSPMISTRGPITTEWSTCVIGPWGAVR